MENQTLDVPFLRKGCGATVEDGGCVMQICDWVYSGGWSDSPETVEPWVRNLAVAINDSARDEQRQKLLGFIPRMIGTRGVLSEDELTDAWNAVWLGFEGNRVLENQAVLQLQTMSVPLGDTYVKNFSFDESLEFLDNFLDAFDAVRVDKQEMPVEKLREVAELCRA